MSRPFFNVWPFRYNDENWPNSITFWPKKVLNFFQLAQEALKNRYFFAKVAKFRLIWSHWTKQEGTYVETSRRA